MGGSILSYVVRGAAVNPVASLKPGMSAADFKKALGYSANGFDSLRPELQKAILNDPVTYYNGIAGKGAASTVDGYVPFIGQTRYHGVPEPSWGSDVTSAGQGMSGGPDQLQWIPGVGLVRPASANANMKAPDGFWDKVAATTYDISKMAVPEAVALTKAGTGWNEQEIKNSLATVAPYAAAIAAGYGTGLLGSGAGAGAGAGDAAAGAGFDTIGGMSIPSAGGIASTTPSYLAAADTGFLGGAGYAGAGAGGASLLGNSSAQNVVTNPSIQTIDLTGTSPSAVGPAGSVQGPPVGWATNPANVGSPAWYNPSTGALGPLDGANTLNGPSTLDQLKKAYDTYSKAQSLLGGGQQQASAPGGGGSNGGGLMSSGAHPGYGLLQIQKPGYTNIFGQQKGN